MASVKVQIDGKWVKADTEETILDVAKRNNIEIPHLCHDDQLEPYGSCFVCVVKVEGSKFLKPSCATKVTDGMVITTRDKEIDKSRKMAIELLLSNHFADCLGPCKINCPADVDVQGYVALAAMGKYREAIKLVKQQNPFPTVCGRVCTRPCELNCRRDILDEGVAVDDIKRFVADKDLFGENRYFPDVKPARPEKVAIVGAGPGGLTCAYYLAQEGFQIDVFEAQEKAGGMLRYGIPTYRLPSNILDKEIEGITGLGVKIHTKKRLGKDFTIDSLFKDGYKSVFLALGAQSSTHIAIEGEDLDNVLAGIEFLAQVENGQTKRMRGTVAVIGGGNTAIDAARTALRMGADTVKIIYRRTIKEMPANPEEIVAAQHEGIEIMFLNNPARYLGKNGKVVGVECIKMELGEPDASGRRRPVPVENSEFVVDVDYVIEAIGQKADLEGVPTDDKDPNALKLSRWKTLDVEAVTMETNIPGVFAAGDVVLGPATAVEAIGGGKKAAIGIYHYITGRWLESIKQPFISKRDNFRELTPADYIDFEKIKRHSRPELEVKERIKNFDEVELVFPEEDVLSEAVRCLECGCKVFFDCRLQQVATDYQADQKNFIGDFQEYKKDTRHPFIEFDMNKCILCSKCIRICEEVAGMNALGLVNRGFVAKVAPSLEKPLQETSCISCGLCVDVCPTGAISDIYHTTKPGPWDENKKRTVCDFCSVGCEVDADVIGGELLKITTPEDGKANPFGNLCFKGRYGFRYSFDNDKIEMPHIRKNGELEEVEWEEAADFIIQKMKEGKDSYKGDHAAVITSPQLAMEELYQLQKFGRMVLETNQIGSADYHENLLAKYGDILVSNGTARELPVSDAVIVLGCDPEKTHPVVSFELNKYVNDNSSLFVIHEQETRLAKKSHYLPVTKKQYGVFADMMSGRMLNGKFDSKVLQKLNVDEDVLSKLESLSGDRKKVTLIWELSQWKDAELQQIMTLVKTARENGWKILTLTAQANSNGMALSGAHQHKLPGAHCFKKVQEETAVLWHKTLPVEQRDPIPAVLEKNPNALWIFGEDILGTAGDNTLVQKVLDNTKLTVVADHVWNKTAEKADVVLPLAVFYAKDGLLVNYENRLQKLNPVVEDNTQAKWIALINRVAAELDYAFMPQTVDEIRGELARSIPWLDGEFIAKAVNGEAFVPPAEMKDVPEKIEVPVINFSQNVSALKTYVRWFADENGIKM